MTLLSAVALPRFAPEVERLSKRRLLPASPVDATLSLDRRVNLDVERARSITRLAATAEVLVDGDFLATLAQCYASRFTGTPSAYSSVLDAYEEHLLAGTLTPADHYIFLDLPFPVASDRPFYARRFFHTLLHPSSPRRALRATWLRCPDAAAVASTLAALTVPKRAHDLAFPHAYRPPIPVHTASALSRTLADTALDGYE